MFTGIVEQLGTLRDRRQRGPGARLQIAHRYEGLVLGESIAVSGVCLTVDSFAAGVFEADASLETLERSTLGALSVGASLNLERALQPTSRLGGHLVGGHVDAKTKLLYRSPLGEAIQLRFQLPEALAGFLAPKGSVALDGVSLTVNEVDDATHSFTCVLIPHTLARTTLAELTVGGQVNLEVDVLARYVARQLKHGATSSTDSDASLLSALRGAGYL